MNGKSQHTSGYTVERTWNQLLSSEENPAELATIRVDFAEWIGTLAQREKAIVDCFLMGETTSFVSGKFGVSPGRVSQLRYELVSDYMRFQGE
jgi:hypothetical protein